MNTREIAAEYRLAHWAQIMQNRRESGMSVKAFCENSGIHANSYYYWQKKLREATCEGLARTESGAAGLVPPGFAEVKLASRAVLPTAASSSQSICVEVPGARITADIGYPAEKLAYLMRAVMQPC